VEAVAVDTQRFDWCQTKQRFVWFKKDATCQDYYDRHEVYEADGKYIDCPQYEWFCRVPFYTMLVYVGQLGSLSQWESTV
jgi:hypothetical protein